MKTVSALWLARLLILSFFIRVPAAFANTCNEECASSADCSMTCGVCIGTCVDCWSLGSQDLCDDPGSGADSVCQWDGQRCKGIYDAPEMPPGTWAKIVLPLAALVIFLSLSQISPQATRGFRRQYC